MVKWLVFGALVGLSAYDMKEKKVKVAAVAFLGMAVVVYRLYIGAGAAELFSGLVPGILLLVVSFVTRGSIGEGDGLVLCVLGLFCGVKQTVAILGMAFFLCAALSVLLLLCRRVNKKTELPFLPCLCSGYVLYLLW